MVVGDVGGCGRRMWEKRRMWEESRVRFIGSSCQVITPWGSIPGYLGPSRR